MTDRISNERIAELAAGLVDALRQTLADLAQAEATIATRDAENVRLRAALSKIESAFPAAAETYRDVIWRDALRDIQRIARAALPEGEDHA